MNKKTTKKKYFPNEILINSALAAGLVFFSTLTVTKVITFQVLMTTVAAAAIVFLTRLKAYLGDPGKKGQSYMFNFIGK